MRNFLATPPLTPRESLMGRWATRVFIALYILGAAAISFFAALALMRAMFFFGGGTYGDFAILQGAVFSLLVWPLATWVLASRYGWHIIAPVLAAVFVAAFLAGLVLSLDSCRTGCAGLLLLGLLASAVCATLGAAFLTGPVPRLAWWLRLRADRRGGTPRSTPRPRP